MNLPSPGPDVRGATLADAAACAAIYAPYVTDTAISFEAVPPTAEEMAARISTAVHSHAWMVLEDEGQVAGYAYGGSFHSRAAYRWCCEVSVYLEIGRRRTGRGARALRRPVLPAREAGLSHRGRRDDAAQ